MLRRAFTAAELVTSLALCVAVGAMLLVAGGKSRAASQLAGSTANLERIAALSASYAMDTQDRTAAFSWRGGQTPPTQYSDLASQALGGTDLVAAAAQAVDILRRRSDQPEFPIVANWIPHVLFTHLVLVDYAAGRLPDFDFISSADAFQLGLATTGTPGSRAAYTSSYELNPFFFQPDRRPVGGVYAGVTQGSSHRIYQSSTAMNGVLGSRAVSDIRFPSQKAHIYDREQRHFGARYYFGFTQSRVLVLAADGSVAVRVAGKCNPGVSPTQPTSLAPIQYTYSADIGEPPAPGGSQSGTVQGYLRWTRGGLEGRDFDGTEIDTSAW